MLLDNIAPTNGNTPSDGTMRQASPWYLHNSGLRQGVADQSGKGIYRSLSLTLTIYEATKGAAISLYILEDQYLNSCYAFVILCSTAAFDMSQALTGSVEYKLIEGLRACQIWLDGPDGRRHKRHIRQVR